MSWLAEILGIPDHTPGPDMSALSVDIHSHLLPGIDDGVKNLEESVALIRKYAGLGYKKLITTPHVSERFPNEPALIQQKLSLVNEALEKEHIPIIVEAAAEYMIEERFEQLMNRQPLMTFGDHNILIECSYYFPYPTLLNIIYDLQNNGYNIILAHAERYTYWHHKLDEYEKLRDRDVRFQVNFSSLTGPYPFGMKKMVRKLIALGWVDYAGSDVHSARYFEWFRKGILNTHGRKLIASGLLKNSSL